MIDDFIERKWGRKEVHYELPGDSVHPGRDARCDGLSGTGDADIGCHCGIFAR